MAVSPWVTYRMADGSEVYGEFAFVTDTEFFDEVEEPTEVIKETWLLVSAETVTFRPSGWEHCETCDEWTCDLEAHREEEHDA